MYFSSSFLDALMPIMNKNFSKTSTFFSLKTQKVDSIYNRSNEKGERYRRDDQTQMKKTTDNAMTKLKWNESTQTQHRKKPILTNTNPHNTLWRSQELMKGRSHSKFFGRMCAANDLKSFTVFREADIYNIYTKITWLLFFPQTVMTKASLIRSPLALWRHC